jgi:hypothetical protein
MIARTSLVAGMALLLVLVAGCDDGGYQKAGSQKQAAGGPVTGILIVAQTIEGESVDLAHDTVKTWNVVDSAGQKIFGKDQIGAEFLKLKGVKYDWHRSKILEGSSQWLGKNYKEIHVTPKVSGAEKSQTVAYVVTPEGAAELRAIANLDTLVKRCNLAILLGKIGQ